MRMWMIVAVATALFGVVPLASADSCYDPYNRNFDCNTQTQRPSASKAAPQKPARDTTRLRDELRRRLNDARSSESDSAREPTREPAAKAAAPAPLAQTAPDPAPSTLTNVAEVNGYVFVCDGPVDSAQVTCREIQHDGRQCIAITANEGVIGWRDSIDTPCSAQDLAQRDAFLASNREAAAASAAAGMSNECRDMALNYVAAAEASNGPAAQAAYEALQKAGGCGVLSTVDAKAAPAATDPRFVARGATPMLDRTVVACDQQPAACAAVVNQLRAGTASDAVAAMYSNAIAIGLQIGAAMGQVVLNAQQMSLPRGAAQPRTGSAAPGAVRTVRGPSGAVTTRPPPAVPGCKIGGVGWCTAQ